MTTTHHLYDDDDITAGYFSDDYGKELFKYRYDRDTKTLHVETANFGRRRELGGIGIDRLSEDELRDRLISIAQEIRQMCEVSLYVRRTSIVMLFYANPCGRDGHLHKTHCLTSELSAYCNSELAKKTPHSGGAFCDRSEESLDNSCQASS